MKFVIRNCQCIVVNRDNIPLACNGRQHKKSGQTIGNRFETTENYY